MICIKLSLHQQRVHLIQVKDEEGKVIATHFPRKDVQSGLMSMKQANNAA